MIKQILIFLYYISISFLSLGQAYQQPNSYGYEYKRFKADLACAIPKGRVNTVPNSIDSRAGYLLFDTSINKMCIWNGTDWDTLNNGSGIGFINPMTTSGDMIYDSLGITTRLPLGSNALGLVARASGPTWENVVLSITTSAGSGLLHNTAAGVYTMRVDSSIIPYWDDTLLGNHFLVTPTQLNSSMSGTTNFISKFTGTNTIGNSLVWDNGTNVIIGATSSFASYPFEIQSNSNGEDGMVIQNKNTGNNAGAAYASLNNDGSIFTVLQTTNSSNTTISPNTSYLRTNSVNGIAIVSQNKGPITFQTNGSGTDTVYGLYQRMIIDSLGNVGIGNFVNHPIGYKLAVLGTFNTQSVSLSGSSSGIITELPPAIITSYTWSPPSSVAASTGMAMIVSAISGSSVTTTWSTAGGGGSIATFTPTATTASEWDASKNMSANNFIQGWTTTATAAATTTLTVASTQRQDFTGSTTQSVLLPVTSTLITSGYTTLYIINNISSGIVTVYSSGSTSLLAIAPGQQGIFYTVGTGHTDGTDWAMNYSLASTLGSVTSYNGVTLAGNGLATVVSSPRLTGLIGATSLTAYTVGASDADFLVSANINVTASTVHSFTCTCTYTDETNTSRVLTLNFSIIAGTLTTTIANAAGAVPYEGVPLQIRAKAATTITFATTGTFTTVTYNFGAKVIQF